MRLNKQNLLLYIVTDRSWLNGDSLERQVENSIIAGATCIQLREKNLSFHDFVQRAQSLKKITDAYTIPFIINDCVDVALAVNADGVHVGQSDLANTQIAAIRDILGQTKVLGVSVQTTAQALDAEKQGADYLGVGAVFSTATKNDADSVSLETLSQICARVSIPVIAIGGINAHTICQLSGSGIAGVAIVSAIFASHDIKAATAQLLTLAQKTVTISTGCL